jgi:spore coat protein U-like protein
VAKMNAARCVCLLSLGFAALTPAARAACTLGVTVIATPASFGLYNPGLGTPIVANGTVTISCTGALGTLPSLVVALSAGANGTFAQRKLASGSARLGYNLYTTSVFSSVWGDGTGGSVTQSYSSGGLLTILTAYGQVPTGQFASTGLYSDTITVTVTY